MSYQEIADDERLDILAAVMDYIRKNEKWKHFPTAEDPELTKEDREFICRIMKLDPRDRPTAKELLQDEWLNSDKKRRFTNAATRAPQSASYESSTSLSGRAHRILVGELLVPDVDSERIEACHKIRKHVQRSGRFLSTV